MDTPLSMVSIACRNGHIKESLLTQFNWPVVHFLGLEFDAELRKSAAERFSKIRSCSSEFSFFVFNSDKLDIKEQFDIVFVYHSLHHATEIEKTLEKINRMLKPNGLFILLDYFGPTAFKLSMMYYQLSRSYSVICQKISVRTQKQRNDSRREVFDANHIRSQISGHLRGCSQF